MEKVLIVDDIKDDRLLYRIILEEEGYEVSEAKNAIEALKLLDRQRFNIVLTDIIMPAVNGIELTRKITRNYPDIEVIAMSIYDSKFTALDALKHGASAYLIKPFTKEELRIAVGEVRRIRVLKIGSGHLDGIVALHKASKAIISDNPPDKILSYIMEVAVNTVRADGGSIMLIDKKSGDYVVKSSAGTFKEKVLGKKFRPGQRIAGRAIKLKRPVLVDNGVRSREWFKNMEKYEDIISGMSVPIIIRNEVLGTVNLKRTETKEEFSRRDVEIVDILAANAALIIENARLVS